MKKFLTEAEKGYIAGFLDADGSISITRWNGSITLYWCNTDQNVIDWIAFKLSIKSKIRTDRKNKQVIYRANVSAKKASDILKLLFPYLKVKKNQALIAIEFETTHNKPYRAMKVSKAIIVKRKQLTKKMRKLNRNYKKCRLEYEEVLD